MNILMENKHFLICEKPIGVPSQSDGKEDMVKLVSDYIKNQAYIINRLDQPVGGLVLFAKDKKTADLLTQRLNNNEIDKYYMAVACGRTEEKEFVESYLFHNKRENVSKTVNKGSMGAKLSQLEYTKIAEVENEYGVLTLLKIKLFTGRHHQIRAQMLSKGNPLFGDMRYNKDFRFRRGCQLALYSCGLKFSDPYTNEEVNVNIKPVGQAFDYFQGEIYD